MTTADNSNTESATATREQLIELWQLLLEQFLWYLENTPPQKMRASMLGVIASYLKDNHVSVDGASIGDLKRSLKELHELRLPFTHHH